MLDDVHPSFGKLLRRYRQAARLSQDELSLRTGLSVRAISDLEREINRSPRKATLMLLATGLELSTEQQRNFEVAAWPSDGRVPHNLPAQLTNLVGRNAEVASVCSMVRRPELRLVSILGAGGVGKTRLALQAALDMLTDFPDGTWFVELEHLTDSSQVLATIAQVLQVREEGSRPLVEAVHSHLRNKQVLLVLDNFEHVLSAAPVVNDLLAAAPHLKVLATSRERLHVRGEHQFGLLPLSVPGPRHLHPLTTLSEFSRYDAVTMFIQRARQVRPNFELTDENTLAVAEICCRVDGLPLAIELAAARTRVLSPQAILIRLSEGLQFLTGGERDLPARQQTLWATIRWSYELLSPREQLLFRRLSVFAAGCTLEAITSVCGTADSGTSSKDHEADVLSGLTSLLDKSLIRQEGEASEEPRFGMLNSIREYASDLHRRYESEAEAASLTHQHADYYRELFTTAATRVLGRGQVGSFSITGHERANARAAFYRACEAADAESALSLVVPMTLFWIISGDLSDGRLMAERALTLPGRDTEAARSWRAQMLVAASVVAMRQGDLDAAIDHTRKAIRLWEDLKPRAEGMATGSNLLGYASALIWHGAALGFLGDHVSARGFIERGIALARKEGSRSELANGLHSLGLIASRQEDYTTARAAFEEALALSREWGDRWAEPQCLNSLGDLARIEGDYESAGRHYEQALALFQALDVKADIPAALHNLGYVALAQGETRRAAALFQESLDLHVEYQNRAGVAEGLSGLAGVAAQLQQPVLAGHLFGAAQVIGEELGATISPADRADYERNLAAAQNQVDVITWTRVCNEGRRLPVDQALAEASKIQLQS